MKKINLYDYQQEMLENITKVLTGRAQVTFYDQNGKKIKSHQACWMGNKIIWAASISWQPYYVSML